MDRQDRQQQANQILSHVTTLASELVLILHDQNFADLPTGDFESSDRLRADHMVRTFVLIQAEHLKSAVVLVSAGQHRDGWLVVRSMVEGIAQLIWALSDEPRRTDEWFWFGAVEDWRQLNQNRQHGLPESPEAEKLVSRLIKKHGNRYLSKDARTKQSQGEPLPVDPYRQTWHRITISGLFDDLTDNGQSSGQLRQIYRAASEWVHWNPRAVFRSIDQDAGLLRYEPHDAGEAARAMVYGVSFALDTIRVANARFQLGLTGEIERYSDRLAVAHKHDQWDAS